MITLSRFLSLLSACPKILKTFIYLYHCSLSNSPVDRLVKTARAILIAKR